VYSYSKSSGVVTVVLFNPDAYVQIPGGYEWYKLSSAQLLGKIDNMEVSVLQRTFETLIGAPVDTVSSQSKIAASNVFDKAAVTRILDARNDKLLVIDARDSTYSEKNQKRYKQEALDSRLRGYFYRKISETLPLTVESPPKKGRGGERIGRIIEGTGIKVLAITYNGKEVPRCTFTGPRSQKNTVYHLLIHWNCRYVENDSYRSILFQPGTSLATLYL
jgi:hypothetical protein